MLLYGRGAASVGEQIGKTKEEAEEILNKFFTAFPMVKSWIDASVENCRKIGYVEDIAGRRRRLPDINLPKYTVRYVDKEKNKNGDFNPFIGCKNRENSDPTIKSYLDQLNNCKSKQQVDKLKNNALYNGIEIINNGGFISQAERQCVNARVQGGAATLTKCALNKIYRDERLKALNAELINTVHDEILMEVPSENAEKAAEYLCEDMINSAKVLVPVVPMASDSYCVDMWYQDEVEVGLQAEYKSLISGDPKKNIKPVSNEEAEEIVIRNHSELLPEDVKKGIKGTWSSN